MKTAIILIKRNVKLFFKDKGLFFTSLITPAILLVLYATFLSNVYRDTFELSIPASFKLSESLMSGLVGGQLVSSILAVSCVTVAFNSNFLMVQDKVNGSAKDLSITPLRPSTLSLCYYVASITSTLIICLTSLCICLGYLSIVGWYMSLSDVIFLTLDVILLVLFGTAISSVINFFLSSQGQISAVGTIIGSCYGFVCGAYMPISSFSEGLQKIISFLPGTYGTALVRNHCLRGALAQMEAEGIPCEVTDSIRDGIDMNVYFFGERVDLTTMYLILGGTVLMLVLVYVLMNRLKKKV